ncbi:MAG: translation initiation factor IF-2 subunit alpha [Candidatus Nitrosocaldus sp.]|nr:translation initiation factor IF-2 subunit alpha [Candidatus Nitrosocaldus sp.]MCS7141192.1 translation initiation factor IF-2 subunit alpha [Candidatus Nitrosocaldus sp.]MDW8000202.1 translation initiation factor IF-2 subunit alpha [Candidatus Nitrosocaldus sp.]MDW8275797.1 translation initiation factor IF-2 subunit alpha [Candidatus Nitrosocaldus sp.]
MRYQQDQLPEEGDLVMATVQEVFPQGAYVTLDEYGGMLGFLHVSEIATGWIRNIEHYVRPKQKVVLKVIRVNRARREVDLSLRQVTHEERRLKVMEVKRAEKASAFLNLIRERCSSMSDAEFERCVALLRDEYPMLYDMFEEVASKGTRVLEGLNLPRELIDSIVEISSKIPLPRVEVGGVLELTCPRADGMNVIKDVLASVEGNKHGADVSITYLGAPRYRLVISAENFKVAERALNSVLQSIQKGMERKGGTFKFTREESRKSVRSQ